jgi:hypothetical protein
MDRVTGKTQDAYIEFINMREAVNAVRIKEINRNGGRGGRLGNRFVALEVTGQEQLMAALFPKARNVLWQGAKPEIIPADPEDPYNTGFKGFINSEELVLLVKQVENPNLVSTVSLVNIRNTKHFAVQFWRKVPTTSLRVSD